VAFGADHDMVVDDESTNFQPVVSKRIPESVH